MAFKCRACSFRRRPGALSKKRKSFDNLVDLEAWANAEQVRTSIHINMLLGSLSLSLVST